MVMYGCTDSQNFNSVRVKCVQKVALLLHSSCPRRNSHQHVTQQISTATERISRCKHGVAMTYLQIVGVDQRVSLVFSQTSCLYQLHHLQRLIIIIRCKCNGRRDSKSCTCRKNGLQCTPACGHCRGIICMHMGHECTRRVTKMMMKTWTGIIHEYGYTVSSIHIIESDLMTPKQMFY